MEEASSIVSSSPAKLVGKKLCKLGSDCDSTDPKHFFDFDHYHHPREEEMLDLYEDMLEEEQRKRSQPQPDFDMSAFAHLTEEEKAAFVDV